MVLFSGAVPRRPTNVARDTKERAWARAAGAAVRARGRNMAGQVGEMCITNKRRFSLFAIVTPDNPGLLFITAITYCRLQSRRVDFTLTPAVVYHHTPGCPRHASAQW